MKEGDSAILMGVEAGRNCVRWKNAKSNRVIAEDRAMRWSLIGCLLLLVPAFGQETSESLEAAYRRWARGLDSANKDEQIRTLRSMLPNKADIQYLLPKDADKVWALYEKINRDVETKLEQFAKEFAREKEITGIRVHDIRNDKFLRKSYEELFAILPKEARVYSLSVDMGMRSRGGSLYVFRNGRWFIALGLEEMPKFLAENK